MKFAKTLTRDEMKHMIGGATCSCTYNGCDVTLTTTSSGWELETCDGTWSGSGPYGGTVCGGECPSSSPSEN